MGVIIYTPPLRGEEVTAFTPLPRGEGKGEGEILVTPSFVLPPQGGGETIKNGAIAGPVIS